MHTTNMGDSRSEVLELSPDESVQLEGFVNLLADLNIIDAPTAHAEATAADIGADEMLEESIAEFATPQEWVFHPGSSIQSSVDISIQSSVDINIEKNSDAAIVEPAVPVQLDIWTIEPQARCSEDTIATLEQLQRLLVGPELEKIQSIQQTLTQKAEKIEHQIYDPEALIELMLPSITEILNRKIAASTEDVVGAIAPIIDQVIENRIVQDKAKMSRALAPTIPAAITQQIQLDPEEMATALSPMMGVAIKKQIEIQQDAIVDALYPIIGGTITKYLAETIQEINKQVEDAFSIKGIKRKVRAKMQGVSEAELILRESSSFSIQALFLIHKASGLIISEMQNETGQILESDMIAGMLTAIRSFVNDCIAQSGTTSELDAIDYGNSKIMLEVAGHCYLAIVVQGEPPKAFIHQVRQTMRSLVRDYGSEIEKFEGDPSTISPAVHTTLAALKTAVVEPAEAQENASPALLYLGLGIFAAIALPWGYLQYRAQVNHQAEQQVAIALASAPELAVYRLDANVEHDRQLKLTGKLPNSGLRDRAEALAKATLPHWTIDNAILAVETPPDIVLAATEVKRTTTLLNQRSGTAISTVYNADRVTIQGTVRNDDEAQQVTAAFERIPGVKTVLNTVKVQPLRIDARFYFEFDSAVLNPADLDEKIQQVQALLKQHPNKHINLIGYSYPTQGVDTAQQLAIARAKTVQAVLMKQGIASDRLHISGSTTLPPAVRINQAEWMRRCVVVEAFTPEPR